MTLEAIYYIGQTVAVVLIFPTLIFLAIQNRQSQKQIERANKIARAEFSGKIMNTHKELTLRMVDDAELGRAFRQLTIEKKRIEDVDMLTRLLGWFGAYHTLWLDARAAHEKGLVDEFVYRVVSGNEGFYLTFPVVWKNILNVTQQRELEPRDYDETMVHIAAVREKALAYHSDLVAKYMKQREVGDTLAETSLSDKAPRSQKSEEETEV